jgi:glutamate decarboxylase
MAIEDMLVDDGNARQNLATFCQTYMEPDGVELIKLNLQKNGIDKTEYPRTTEIESRCVKIIGDLWCANKVEKPIGTSTVGSSECFFLGGIALKKLWQKNAEEAGVDIRAKSPNLIISSGYQVCWDKFATYLDIELRTVPITLDNLELDVDKAIDLVDDYTIGIVGILGNTYTGHYDDISALDGAVEEYNKDSKIPIYIHVDAASGGFYAPFITPNRVWDFRLKNVNSINSSGHKYGLVYPGVGWVIWRGKDVLPKDMLFEVSYLGGSMPTMGLNFSRSAAQVVGQYYNFTRFGRYGYTTIHERTMRTAERLLQLVRENDDVFEIIGVGLDLPVVCYTIKDELCSHLSLYDLSDRLKLKGWLVPAYPLPKDIDDIIVHRLVLRADFSQSIADDFADDWQEVVKEWKNGIPKLGDDLGRYGFTH